MALLSALQHQHVRVWMCTSVLKTIYFNFTPLTMCTSFNFNAFVVRLYSLGNRKQKARLAFRLLSVSITLRILCACLGSGNTQWAIMRRIGSIQSLLEDVCLILCQELTKAFRRCLPKCMAPFKIVCFTQMKCITINSGYLWKKVQHFCYKIYVRVYSHFDSEY